MHTYIHMTSIDLLLETIFNHPLTYVAIIFIGFFLIVHEMNKGKLKPEQKVDFGVEYREKRTKKHLKKREKSFGFKPEKKTILFYGIRSLGRVLNEDGAIITVKEKDRKPEDAELRLITYRRFGFFNWLKTQFGFGKLKVIVDTETLEEGEDRIGRKWIRTLAIPTNAFFRENAGILYVSKKGAKKFVDQINSDLDLQNSLGYVSDFPRRLSNLHPSHAMQTDTMETEQALEEKSKRSFIDKFRRG